MSEITEREQKLLDIIQYYMEMNSLRTITLYKIYNILMWENRVTAEQKFDIRQHDYMEYLEKEFGLTLTEYTADGKKVEKEEPAQLTPEQQTIVDELEPEFKNL